RVVRAVDGARGRVARRVVAAGARPIAAPAARRADDVTSVRGHPVPRFLLLRRAEREPPGAHELVQLVLQHVLGPGAPAAGVRLGPEIPDVVGTSDLQRDQVVDLVLVRDVLDPVAGVHGFLLRRRDVPRAPRVPGLTDAG